MAELLQTDPRDAATALNVIWCVSVDSYTSADSRR